ncbi:MAG TPA: hypothetical protein VL251_08920 [Thermomonas sp.]|jgi:hypothetical protein|nr:hypothetical protein [Thermomonas sp.]
MSAVPAATPGARPTPPPKKTSIIETRLAKVKEAEVECERSGLAARNAWQALKEDAKAAATPWRIVAAGAITGFLVGRSGGKGGESVGGKVFASLAQSLITMLSAGATAGVAAGAAADAAADATVDATAEAVEQVHDQQAVAPTAAAKPAVDADEHVAPPLDAVVDHSDD